MNLATPLALALCHGLFTTPPCTTVIPMKLSEIVQTAQQIVVGTADASVCRWNATHTTIRTFVTFKDLAVQKGAVPAATFTLDIAGGQVGDERIAIDDIPAFTIGKRYLLYVDGNGTFLSPIVGFNQGAFEITNENGREVLKNLRGEQLIGVKDDRFVFLAKSPAPASQAPAAVRADTKPQAARGDVDAFEKEQQRQMRERQTGPRTVEQVAPLANAKPLDVPNTVGPRPAAPDQLGAKKNLDEARPIYVDAKDDTGVRASLHGILNLSR